MNEHQFKYFRGKTEWMGKQFEVMKFPFIELDGGKIIPIEEYIIPISTFFTNYKNNRICLYSYFIDGEEKRWDSWDKQDIKHMVQHPNTPMYLTAVIL